MAVITKKDGKIATVVHSLPDGVSTDDFIHAFQQQHPQDWSRILREFEAHERKTKPGNTHPMPEPRQYLVNALNVYRYGVKHRPRSGPIKPVAMDLDGSEGSRVVLGAAKRVIAVHGKVIKALAKR